MDLVEIAPSENKARAKQSGDKGDAAGSSGIDDKGDADRDAVARRPYALPIDLGAAFAPARNPAMIAAAVVVRLAIASGHCDGQRCAAAISHRRDQERQRHDQRRQDLHTQDRNGRSLGGIEYGAVHHAAPDPIKGRDRAAVSRSR